MNLKLIRVIQNKIFNKSNTFSGKNNSKYLNQKQNISNNSIITKSDFISSGFNENINISQLSQPINNSKRNNFMINKSKTTSNSNLRHKSFTQRNKKPNINQNYFRNDNINNIKHFSYNKNNNNNLTVMKNKNFETNQLLEILKQLKKLNICNIENKKDILNFQQEYISRQNILLNAIQNFANIKPTKEINNSSKLKQVNEIKNKLLSDINILNNEKNSMLNEI